MARVNSVFADRPTTIFEVMSRLARDAGAINLGQGFPDEDGPLDVREMAAKYAVDGPNQYPPMMGVPELRQAVGRCNARFYGLDVDWESQVLVTSGATEALAAALFGLLEPGDEAILLEPYYDCYLPIIEAAGAKAVCVALRAPDWTIPERDLAAAFSERTKLIVLNTPLNPVGTAFGPEELSVVAELVKKHDAFAVCDEVYEHILFDGRAHVPLMTLPGMADRCIRIGSAGKTFSLTGWKVGYATGAPRLIAAMAKAHQYLTFTTPPALQLAVAYGLDKDDAYYAGLARDMQQSRDLLTPRLKAIGFDVVDAQGTYFLTADISSLGYDDDAAFCKEITEKAKVAAVPISAFYHPHTTDAPRTFARFCFCKRADVLEEAAARLEAYFARRS